MRFPRERLLVADHRRGLVPEVRDLLHKCQNEGRTGWLSIQTENFQGLVFLEAGQFRGAGTFSGGHREPTEMDLIFVQIAGLDYGIVSFYETKASLMKMLLATFRRTPKSRTKILPAELKKVIRASLEQKLTGFLEIEMSEGLNYLFFVEGMATEIYPCDKQGQVGDLGRLKEFLDGMLQSPEEIIVGIYEFQVKRG